MTVDTQKGFTLTEALVAVAIFSGVVVATAPVLQTALKSSSRVSASASTSEQLRTAEAVFRSRFAQAVYPGASIAETGFKGDQYSLSFLTIDRVSQNPVPSRFDLSQKANEWVLLASTQGDQPSDETAMLLTSLSSVQFSYFGTPHEADQTEWHDQWEGPQPPQLVAVEGMIENSGRDHPFRFDVNVGGEAPLACSFDSISRRCRGEP